MKSYYSLALLSVSAGLQEVSAFFIASLSLYLGSGVVFLKDGPFSGLVLVVYSRLVDGVMRIFFKQFVRFLKITRVDTARINSRSFNTRCRLNVGQQMTSISFVLIRMTNSSVSDFTCMTLK